MTTAIQTTQQGILAAYHNGNLLTRVKNDNGKVKTISMQRISKMLCLPLAENIKKFNATLGAQDHKFSCTAELWTDEQILVYIEARENYGDEFPASFYVQFDHNGKRYVPTTLDDDMKPLTVPYGKGAFNALPGRMVSAAINLPLVYMYKEGLVSAKQFSKVLFSYLTAKASKLGLSLSNDVAQQLGQAIWTTLLTEGSADFYSVKDYLENFFKIEWSLIEEHAKQVNTEQKLVALPETHFTRKATSQSLPAMNV